jgi:hypothetical protein
LGVPVRARRGNAAWKIPEEWESLRRGGPGPFVTWETARRPDGVVVEFSSRRQRKGLGPRPVAAADGHRPCGRTPARRARRRAVRWAPHLLGWWIAVLFMIGSACFAGAAAPGLSSVAPASVLGAVFFTGSLFFTSAAYLQYLQSINAAGAPGEPPRRRLLAWQPGRIDWWACGIQLVGTVWVQHQHLRRAARGPDRAAAGPPDMDARHDRFGLLPRGQLAGAGGGLSRALVRAAR